MSLSIFVPKHGKRHNKDQLSWHLTIIVFTKTSIIAKASTTINRQSTIPTSYKHVSFLGSIPLNTYLVHASSN